MATTLTSSTLSGTYKDDFDADKGYHRLLFNSGRALQARELTQLQTVIQEEIARLGKNLFKEGAAVGPGAPSINAGYEFIKLNTTTNTLPATPDDLVGVEFTGQTSGVKARVLQVVEAENSDPATLYVQYTNTSAATAGSSPIRMSAAENIVGGAYTLTVQTANTVANPAVGKGTRFSNGAGDFFAQGHFVRAPAQSILLSKYSTDYTGVVGFKVTQDIVTTSDDSTLYDNSGVSLDTTAPGADRLRIQLTLSRQEDIDSDEDFVFYSYVVDSSIYEEAVPADDYNVPQQMLALRTFEESGNYIVKPFKLTFEDGDSDAVFQANISPGTAYINGYRCHVKSDEKLVLDKARTTEEIGNQIVAADYGSYVLCKKTTGKDLPEVGDVVNLRSAATYGGSTMGTAAVRYIHDDGTYLRVYLFDIVMNSGQSFRNVLSLGTSSSDYLDTQQINSKTDLNDANNTAAIFTLPYFRPQSLTDISLEVGRQFKDTSNGSGEITLTLTATGETFVNTGDWYIIDNASGGEETGASFSGSGTASVTISGLSNSTSYSIWAKVDKASATVRSKTLTNTTVTSTVDSDGNGIEVLDLGEADIYAVNSINEDSAGGADISHLFTIDYGRRPTHYDQGRLIVPTGNTPPTGNVYVDFDYFAHGASGDFFAANSYIGQVDYEDIPADTLEDGSAINLRNVLDFRPTWNGSSYTDINELPENSTSIRSDVTYYLPRNDLIVMNQDAELEVVQGDPDFDPLFPEIPVNTLELFRISVNSYTLSNDDVVVQKVDHKRYTMKDIARLDQRIEEVRELAVLSLLELDTQNLEVFDSAGNNRTKSGFLVDNFVDHTSSNTTAIDYAAAIDPQAKIMRPSSRSDSIRMIYDSDKSSNVALKGDNVLLDYTEVDYLDQPQVSGYENINPFAVVSGQGYLYLSPTSDEWKEVEYIPAKSVNGGTRLVQTQSLLWNEHLWGWAGTALSNGQVGQEVRTSTSSSNTITTGTWTQGERWNSGSEGEFRTTTTTNQTTVAQVIASEVINEVIDDRLVDIAIIPFMRSRKVYFKAQGLRPNSQFFAWFDGVDVSDWVREEAFGNFAQDGTEYSNLNQNATEHPEGPSTLISDTSGEITGSFYVPSTDNLKFRVGTRQLKLLDISVNDDNAALSGCAADYTAAGLLETRQRTIKSTREVTIDIDRNTTTTSSSSRVTTRTWRQPDDGGSDPLAQSFTVNDPRGVFITKARVYFQSKDDVIPVQAQIRTVVNGIPTATIVPGAQKYLNPADVNVVSTQTQAGVIATPTDFEFDEPIYLSPGLEYALVLKADSVNYNVYVAETEQFILGSTERRITKQASMGSLFLSQNGTTWTPSQKQDMTFKLFRADFDTTGYAIVENADVPNRLLSNNPFSFVSGDGTVTVYHPAHGFNVNDTVTIAGVSGTVAGIAASDLNGDRTITAVDYTGYTFEAGSSSTATSTTVGGGSAVTATRNFLYDVGMPFIQSMGVQGTLLTYQGKFTTGQSLAGTETRYAKDTNYLPIANKENIFFTAPRMIANPTDETAELGAGERSATIRVNMTTTDTRVSPVIDMQRSSMFLVRNIIDKQDASITTGFNVPLNYVDETSASGGSSIAKHITKPVTLAEQAVGLKIMLSANRPSVADFVVYYRVADEGTILSDVAWVEIDAEESIPSDENPRTFRDYKYLPGGEGGELDPFTKFQMKIVMRSTNSAKVPVFRDLRVIAMAD